MTTLRDDGLLETDDPVVAACFLGQRIDSGYVLCVIRNNGWGSWSGEEQAREAGPYPILIPAKTVAEVWDDDLRVGSVLCEYGEDYGRMNLTDWLRTHTQDTT